MARVPITVMGYRCERCDYEWIPRNGDQEPATCPRCRSPYWNRPRKSMMAYDNFRAKIGPALETAARPLTWTEIRTTVGLPQLFPNNQWVHRLEKDIGLHRSRDASGIIHWQIAGTGAHEPSAEVTKPPRSRSRRQQGILE